MFKKFYFLFIFSCLFISFISSFSNSLNSNKNSNSYLYPTNTTNISSYFGYRELFGKQNFHNGIDFPVAKGNPVFATLSGTVIFSNFNSGYGNSIIILHDNNFKSLYSHLEENYIVKNGQYINAGQLIGYVGPKYLSNGNLNGWTTGPHLHFSIFNDKGIAIDPLTLNLIQK